VKLVWARPAHADRKKIREYIAQHAPAAALALDELFSEKAGLLLDHPDLGRTGRVPGTRELVAHRNYILVYDTADDVVRVLRVLRVLHAARQWPPRYMMGELLAEAETSGQYPLPPEEREWVDAPAVGREWPACEVQDATIAQAIELARRVDAGLEPLTPFDPAEYLDSPEAVAVFLADAAATADPAYIEHARQVAARASAMHGLE
jgi:addiction module RelE/StbE family toxin